MQVRQLSRRMYRGSDNVDVVIENFDTARSSVTVIGPHGQINKVRYFEDTTGSLTTLALVPGIEFVPGKYTVRVESQGTIISSQDFYWGVLAINTNKSMFLPGETADFSMAVLNDSGDIVCNAQARLSITDPAGTVTNLSTDEGTITATSDCGNKEMIVTPDYAARYTTTTVGIYTMDLTATTVNGTYSVFDSFEVRDFVPFDVERTSATRIYPPNFYPMTIKVKANTDFTGEIVETVPASFTVRQGEGVMPYGAVTVDSPPLDPTAYFVHVEYPFTGKYPVELGFGEALTDPLLQEQYKTFGLVGHDGTDFGLPEGTPVLAAGDGVYGTTVVVQHSWGRSYYGHLSSVGVEVGGKVEAGGEIGKSGQTGLTTGPHLHFGIKLKTANMQNGYYGKTDPMPFLTGNATVADSSVKHISWHVSVRAGDEFTIGYQYQAPNVSPQFYLAGPLTFRRDNPAPQTQNPEASGSANPFVLGIATQSGLLDFSLQSSTPSASISVGVSLLFSEIRQWQIAADATDTLYADSDISTTSWTSGTCSTNLWDCINEGTASPNDSDYLKTAKGAGTFSYIHTATDSPSDVQTVTQIDVSVRGYYTVAASTVTVYYSTDGSDPSIPVGVPISLPVTSPSTQTVTASSLSLTKTQIDALRVKFEASVGKNGYVWVQASQYDLTYTPTASGPTTDQQMRHGNWFNSGVEQSFTF